MRREGMEPFLKGDVIESEGRFANISEIKNNPDYISKKVYLSHEDALSNDERLRRFEKNVQILKTHFFDFIPEFLVTYGEGTHTKHEVPYIFMNKVSEAEKLDDQKVESYISQLDDFLEQIIETYIETYNNGEGWHGNEGFVPDITKNSNWMYGTTSKNDNPKLYFVDLYPAFYWTTSRLKEYINKVMAPANKSGHIAINQEYHEISDYEEGREFFPKTIEALTKLENLK